MSQGTIQGYLNSGDHGEKRETDDRIWIEIVFSGKKEVKERKNVKKDEYKSC